jgi:hypothetical protein
VRYIKKIVSLCTIRTLHPTWYSAAVVVLNLDVVELAPGEDLMNQFRPELTDKTLSESYVKDIHRQV